MLVGSEHGARVLQLRVVQLRVVLRAFSLMHHRQGIGYLVQSAQGIYDLILELHETETPAHDEHRRFMASHHPTKSVFVQCGY